MNGRQMERQRREQPRLHTVRRGARAFAALNERQAPADVVDAKPAISLAAGVGVVLPFWRAEAAR